MRPTGSQISSFRNPVRFYRPFHQSQFTMDKSRVLVVGTGGIGTMSAYALEKGGLAEITAVMRSNYDAAVKNGIDIDSVQWGQIKAWKPTASMSTDHIHKISCGHQLSRAQSSKKSPMSPRAMSPPSTTSL